MQCPLQVYCLEIPVFFREHFNGAYRVETYYFTKQLAELPIYLALPILFSTIVYWMVGFNSDVERFFIFIGIIVLISQTVISFGK